MKALLVVDVQNDFCPGGSLAVPEGDRVVPFINTLRTSFPLTIFTRDRHPPDHASFASNHPGTKVGEMITLPGGGTAEGSTGVRQIMWPDHCVRDTPGAELHAGLEVRPEDPVIYKGELQAVDSYSAFLDNDRKHETGLGELLRAQGVNEVDVVGLATDYCVKFTVLDALDLGLRVRVHRQGCRGVNLQPWDEEAAYREMAQAGAEVVP